MIATLPSKAAANDRSDCDCAANGGRSVQEVLRLIDACSAASLTGIRNRALIGAMYRGGLRLGEALDLRPKDVREDLGSITVLHGKGDRRRVVGIDPAAMSLIGRWYDRRSRLNTPRNSQLFCTLAGRRMHNSYVRTLLPRLAKKAGVDKRVHSQGLRHSHAFELMLEGIPVVMIQQQPGRLQ